MSYIVNPRQFELFNRKNRETAFFSGNDNDSFNFKYVPRNQFRHIVKDVQRSRTREKEQNLWSSYLEDEESPPRSDSEENEEEQSGEEEENYPATGISNVKVLMRKNEREADRRWRRLHEEAASQRPKKQIPKICLTERGKRGDATTRIAEAEETDEDEANIPLEKKSAIATARTEKSNSSGTPRSSQIESEEEFQDTARFSIANRRAPGRSRSARDFASGDEMDEEIYDLQSHSLIAHRILSAQKKISILLDEITFRLGRIPLPDGDRDLRRRQQCVAEFAIRFSRNYLYDLGRQIADIRRHVRAISPRSRFKQTRRGFSLRVQAVEQKLLSAHQLLCQALNAYAKHIPSSVLKGQPGKLKEILQCVVDLANICAKIQLTGEHLDRGDVEPPPLGTDMKNRCSEILSKLHLNSDASQMRNRVAQSISAEPNKIRINPQRAGNAKGSLTSRLSMYSPSVRLTRKNVTNREYVARHRRDTRDIPRTPNQYHPTTPEHPHSSPTTRKSRSRENVKRPKKKIGLLRNEDEISTMMSIMPAGSESESSIAECGNPQPSVSIHKNPATRRYQSANRSSNNTTPMNTPIGRPDENFDGMVEGANRMVSDKVLSSQVPIIADIMTLINNQQENDVGIQPMSTDFIKALAELLKKYQPSARSKVAEEKATNGICVDSGRTMTNEISPGRTNGCETAGEPRQKFETRSGTKNMQLISLSAEEASSEKGHFERKNEKKNWPQRSEKGKSILLSGNESSLKSLRKYRQEYYDWSQTNPMYTSKSQNKPWDVVAWIADKLIEEMVVDVTEEFKVEEITQRLLELEFNEF